MIIFTNSESLYRYRQFAGNVNKKTGFVPTMGALHQGHISLVKHAMQVCDVVVVSIFVNPTQFTQPEDLAKYPRTTASDIKMLEAAGCHILYLPNTQSIYPRHYSRKTVDIGPAENILEGFYRPGHFKGVVEVVDILLNHVNPAILFLGQKDFQQCHVLAQFVHTHLPHINIEALPTMRHADGLAMSSRNTRLNDEERALAPLLYKTLLHLKNNIVPGDNTLIFTSAIDTLNNSGFKTEYLVMVRQHDLQEISSWDGQTPFVIAAAAYLGPVRLIDNITWP